MFHRISLPQQVDVVVASFGGVGTTFLCDFLAEFRRTNNSVDADGLKHSPLPPITRNPAARFVYVYGDPIDAVVSLFGRGFHTEQSRKLQRYADGTRIIPRDMTLDEYAQAGRDQFLLERHFRNWYSTWLRQPTLFLRYETVFANQQALIDFLELPARALDQFPQKRERRSRAAELPPATRDALQRMYGDFQGQLNAIGDAEVRIPKESSPQPSWSVPEYRRAIAAQYSPHNILRSFWESSLRSHWKRLSGNTARSQ